MNKKLKAPPREISGGPAVPEFLGEPRTPKIAPFPKAQKIFAASDVSGTFSWQFWYAKKKSTTHLFETSAPRIGSKSAPLLGGVTMTRTFENTTWLPCIYIYIYVYIYIYLGMLSITSFSGEHSFTLILTHYVCLVPIAAENTSKF